MTARTWMIVSFLLIASLLVVPVAGAESVHDRIVDRFSQSEVRRRSMVRFSDPERCSRTGVRCRCGCCYSDCRGGHYDRRGRTRGCDGGFRFYFEYRSR